MPSAERNKAQLQAQGFEQRIKNTELLRGLGEIATYMKCSIGTVRNYIKQKGLPATAVSQRSEYLTTKTAIDKWIMEGHLSRCIKHDWLSD